MATFSERCKSMGRVISRKGAKDKTYKPQKTLQLCVFFAALRETIRVIRAFKFV